MFLCVAIMFVACTWNYYTLAHALSSIFSLYVASFTRLQCVDSLERRRLMDNAHSLGKALQKCNIIRSRSSSEERRCTYLTVLLSLQSLNWPQMRNSMLFYRLEIGCIWESLWGEPSSRPQERGVWRCEYKSSELSDSWFIPYGQCVFRYWKRLHLMTDNRRMRFHK